MTGEEMEKAMAFTLEQQAHLTVTVGRLSDRVERIAEKVEFMAEKVEFMAGKVEFMAGKVERMAEKVDRTADSVTALLAIAEIHDREIKETDERLNALINIVERHISEGRNGKA